MISIDKKQILENDRKMREVYNLKVFVVGGGYQYIQMFHDAGFKGALGVEDADILCFTGGEDVWPGMYGESPHPTTRFNKSRDDYESYIFCEAKAIRKPMIGICRGAQFLNVMNGGKLWQHVNNHAIARSHPVIHQKTGEERFNMTSTHHQMMIPSEKAEIIALAAEATRKESDTQVVELDKPQLEDAEVVWYPETWSLCFQPHPEFQQGDCRDYFLELVDDLIMPLC